MCPVPELSNENFRPSVAAALDVEFETTIPNEVASGWFALIWIFRDELVTSRVACGENVPIPVAPCTMRHC